LRPWPALPASDEGFVVHGHQPFENLQVARWVIRGRKQTAEDAGLVEDQRLPTLPVTAKRSQRLALPSLLLLTQLLYFGEYRMNSHLAMVGRCLANKVAKISIACCPSWSCSWA